MIPQTTEERTAEYTGTATPEFRAACANAVPQPEIAPIYRPAFTPLQDRTRHLITTALPLTLEFTAQALFEEIEKTLRDQQETIENHEKWSEFRTHNAHMRAKLGALMQIVAPIVGETYSPTSTDRASELFIADRITSKICHLLAPGDPPSTDVSVEPPRRKFQPWTAADHNRAVAAMHGVSISVDEGSQSEEVTMVMIPSGVHDQLRMLLIDVLSLGQTADVIPTPELIAIAIRRREAVAVRTMPVKTGEGYDMQEQEIKELQFQNAELSRRLEAAKASMTTTATMSDEVNGWHTAAEKYAEVVEAWRNHLDILTGCALGELGIEAAADLLKKAQNEITQLKNDLANAPKDEDIKAVQKERDELGEIVSDIKLILAKHLADDPALSALSTVDLIDVKLASLKDASEKAYTFDSLKARLQQQVNRLLDFGLHDIEGVKGETDFVGVLHHLVSFRLGAHAVQKQKDAPAPPARAVSNLIPTTFAMIQDKRSPFIKAGGIHEFRTDNPTIEWVSVGDFHIPVPLVKSAIMMAGGSKMPDGQPIHLSHVAKQLSLLPDAGTAIGRCFGGTIGKLRDGAATSGDVDEAIAKRLEKHRVVWPSSESA